MIDWKPIKALIDKDYKKGKVAVGKPAYNGLWLFKISLLQTCYGLSDYEIGDHLKMLSLK